MSYSQGDLPTTAPNHRQTWPQSCTNKRRMHRFHLLHGTCDSTRLVIVRRPHNAHGQALLLGQVRCRAGRQRGGHVHVQERQRSVHLQVLARRVRRQRHRPHRRRRAAEPASAAQRTRESSRMKPTGRTCGSAACACGYVPSRTRQPTRRGRRSRWTRPSSEPQWRGPSRSGEEANRRAHSARRRMSPPVAQHVCFLGCPTHHVQGGRARTRAARAAPARAAAGRRCARWRPRPAAPRRPAPAARPPARPAWPAR